jgi:pimeloyl-ACP methyl ester carboxylesterase
MDIKSFQGLSAAGFHTVSYADWGDSSNKNCLMCVHSLSRNGRDFDFLARALENQYRIICPDMVGRGKSDWLPHKNLYSFPQYMADLNALIARVEPGTLDWVGTSMGGLMGLILASVPNTPIRKLVLNDVGPEVPRKSIWRIAKYLKAKSFESRQDIDNHLRIIYKPFGKLSEDNWENLLKYGVMEKEGKYVTTLDPKIIRPWSFLLNNFSLWTQWEAIKCPVLVIRGEKSDVLTPKIAARMQESKDNMTVVEISDTGHAPSLMTTDQIDIIKDWLSSSTS